MDARRRTFFLFCFVPSGSSTSSPDEEVYLCLLRVYLQGRAPKAAGSSPLLKAPDAEDPAGGGEDEVGGLDEAISLLERHFARVDPVQVMALLPPDVPVAKLLRFLSSAVRHTEARRRNNQV